VARIIWCYAFRRDVIATSSETKKGENTLSTLATLSKCSQNALAVELNFDELRIVLHCIPKIKLVVSQVGLQATCMWVNRTNPRGLNFYSTVPKYTW